MGDVGNGWKQAYRICPDLQAFRPQEQLITTREKCTRDHWRKEFLREKLLNMAFFAILTPKYIGDLKKAWNQKRYYTYRAKIGACRKWSDWSILPSSILSPHRTILHIYLYCVDICICICIQSLYQFFTSFYHPSNDSHTIYESRNMSICICILRVPKWSNCTAEGYIFRLYFGQAHNPDKNTPEINLVWNFWNK